MEGQQLLLYLQGNIFLTNANVYTIPHSFLRRHENHSG